MKAGASCRKLVQVPGGRAGVGAELLPLWTSMTMYLEFALSSMVAVAAFLQDLDSATNIKSLSMSPTFVRCPVVAANARRLQAARRGLGQHLGSVLPVMTLSVSQPFFIMTLAGGARAVDGR